MISIDSRVVANEDLLSTELDGETVMMDVESGQYYALNDVGSRIWRDLAAPVEVAALCRRLEEEYDAPPETIRAGVLRLLDRLLDKRLIRIAG
ncbi:PqqD family peptide modification chaperone [Azospirillum halopraeferens]|uniref:PqqD family peptide modification chaperone n=1 Tax=Azospirillum halopraeferens TaxID=34010 RepID=UPI0004054C4A|nr:PqqD family peptide modification chaperone [Azospirillum halopraeferens]